MGYRYIGSKDKLSDIIIDEIKSINKKADKIIDLMAGTGLFSLALREKGYTVNAVDVMNYSRHHLNVHLFLNEAPHFDDISTVIEINKYNNRTLFEGNNYEAVLNYLNHLEPVKGYFHKEFSPDGNPTDTEKPRKYFTSFNASKIDSIRIEIKKIRENNIISDIEHSLLLHDLIMATNDVANIAGTYGHYLSKFVKRSKIPIKLTPTNFSKVDNFKGHRVFTGYAEEVADKLTGDLCYIDPPYIKRQYAANYHILETIAREDEPKANGVSGLRPWRDQYSNFCSKIKIRGSFDKILTNINCKDFLISYSEDGLLPIEDLMSFLSNYGNVSKNTIEYKRFKSNNSDKDAKLHEYLIHLRKN
jgi:adenine-specific DNA-methyltransferase